MAKELIARGQATIHTQKDAYTINQSVGEYVFSATNDGNIASAVSFISTIKVTLGDTNSTDFTIGTITKPAGFSAITVNNTNKTITYAIAANTANLADNGIITIPVIIKGETYSVSFVWSKTKNGNPGQDGYTVNASRQSYVVSTDKDGKIHTAVNTTTIISAFKGSTAITPTIGTLPSVAGCTLSKSGTTVTIIFNIGTSLAENGTIDIPVTVDAKNFTISFAYAKARTGATGDAGVDANVLDWVADWNTNKTLIGQDSVITPKIFAGVKNSNGTLTGIALGRFALSTLNTSGQVITETIDGIYGFKDGNKTFSVDNNGNAQLGRGNQFVKYNATTGRIEFGAEVSLNWVGATYIDANGIFTGTLSANTVNAINLNASQITAGTINVARIDVASLKASLITAANIEALTLNVVRGKIGGWTMDADSIFLGTKNNTSGAYTATSGAMTIASTGIRGFKWRLDATGAGAVAGGNIAWDASGNVTFASSVSLNWTTPINGITAALGGSSYPKLTQISSVGIYTGTLTAAQVNAVSIDAGSIKTGILNADRIAAGSITATKLDAVSIKANIINTEYINGLECSFVQGTIGGWIIDGESISSATYGIENEASIQIRSVASGSGYWYNGEYNPYGLVMTWNQERGIGIVEQRILSDIIVIPRLRGNGGHFSFGEIAEASDTVKTGFVGIQMMGGDGTEYFCLSANTLSNYTEIYNRIAGWGFDDSSIWKNNVSLGSDGSIRNGSKWQLNDDGSGRLANGNISWDTSGNVTFASSVSLNWTTPINGITTALGGSSYPKLTQITSGGIYTGTLNASQITAGTISADRIAAGSISADKLDAASIRANIINVNYINGLSCTFAQGTIGGWTITSDTIYNTVSGQYFVLRTNETGGSGVSSAYARRGLTLYMEDVAIDTGAVKIVQIGVLGDLNTTQNYPATPNYGIRIALKGGKDVFRADKTGALIAGWNFDSDSIFKGTKANTSGAYTSASGAITMGSNGVRGYKWRLDATGAGAVAGGNIAWDASGNVTFGSSVSLNWINYTDNKVNALDSDGRNYALDTSNNYTNYVGLTNSLNQCIFSYQVNARNWKAGDVIVVSFDYYFSNLVLNTSYTNRISIQGSGDVTAWEPGFNGYSFLDRVILGTTGSIHLSYSLVITAEQARNNTFTLNVRHDYLSGTVSLRNLKVEKNRETGWSPAPEDIGNRLTKITSTGIYTGTITASQINIDSALVVGGSTYNGSISVRDASNSVKVTLDRTGITAVGGTIGGWTISSNQISKNSVILSSDGSITNGTKWKLNNDGSGQVANGNISWTAAGSVSITGTINATAGQIGGFEIGSGRIGSTASGSGSGGGLAIYNDLFRVGSSTSYVLFGDDTFPASAGGAFTATGRITNNKVNTYYTNCGIYIDVTNATRNFGIHSNAALLAPAVIGNKVKTIAFSGSGYSIDFSQCNIFFIYGTSNYSVTLPTESSVATMFGYSTLPSDFGFVFTLVYNYNYGNKLIINSLRDNNGNSVNYELSKGDSITVLCSKFPSFHYQVINHYS